MHDMDEWFFARDPAIHRENAQAWRRCNSDASRSRFVKQIGIRWSELLRLPYFDPVRFVTVDPMHCLFLGIAKWIVKRIWVDEGVLTIHETEIKQFGNRNGRNRVEIISTLGHKSRIVETDYEGRNELRGSKWIIKVEMDYVVRAPTD